MISLQNYNQFDGRGHLMYGFTGIEASYITVASCRISLLLTLFL